MTVMITMTMMMRMKIRTVVTTMMMLMMMANKMILICQLLHWKSWFMTPRERGVRNFLTHPLHDRPKKFLVKGEG